MSMFFFRDGRPCGEPSRSELYGEGVFETFRWKGGPPVHLATHVERMRLGAKFLGIPFPGEDRVRGAVCSAVEGSGLDDAYVKVCLISRGSCRFYSAPEGSELLVAVGDYSGPKPEMSCRITGFRRNSSSPLLMYKTLGYLENVIARRDAEMNGADEALFLNERGEVAEGAATNIFWISGNTLFTPARDCGILPGITREVLIKLSRGRGIEVNEGRFPIESVLSADAVFLTNSLIGMARVVRIDGAKVGANSEIFQDMRDAIFRELRWSRGSSALVSPRQGPRRSPREH